MFDALVDVFGKKGLIFIALVIGILIIGGIVGVKQQISDSENCKKVGGTLISLRLENICIDSKIIIKTTPKTIP